MCSELSTFSVNSDSNSVPHIISFLLSIQFCVFCRSTATHAYLHSISQQLLTIKWLCRTMGRCCQSLQWHFLRQQHFISSCLSHGRVLVSVDQLLKAAYWSVDIDYSRLRIGQYKISQRLCTGQCRSLSQGWVLVSIDPLVKAMY